MDERLNDALDVFAGRRELQVTVDYRSIALISAGVFVAMLAALFIVAVFDTNR